ncbi:hypothetical protein [Streptomyces sp. WMMC897]|uniref:hypothetical protein n=1 Tax=Streptomyces sp. WMMC897 TaxID=3014782 RepID=UPI0022B65F05|nr:hypothetical protein [Streptomyces sp. WMMC897]MCZ7413049.1 hypothetical protein [Streptomyces sp. WMMC897]MCZ7413137.1 hypothetical protein [Streptomyces sp. WMMC897]MCZ7415479.1 hypothetical protein [Streptomyces sp. WMMC897]
MDDINRQLDQLKALDDRIRKLTKERDDLARSILATNIHGIRDKVREALGLKSLQALRDRYGSRQKA